MVIGLDLNFIATAGGVPLYATELLKAFGRVAGEHAFVLLCSSPAAAEKAASIAPPVARIVRPGPMARYLMKLGRSAWLSPLSTESIMGPVAVFHGLNYFLPVHRGRARRIVTLHDLSPILNPEWHPRGRALVFNLALRRTLQRVDHVVTATETIRREAIAVFGLPADRITAVHLGVGEAFQPREPAELKPILDRHGLGVGEYLMYAGAMEPRKNLGRLLDAVALVRGRLPGTPPLVLVGPQGWRNTEILARLGHDGVRHLGYLSPDDLTAVLAGSMAFLYPSLYEGFGLPVLEALACGVPVLASNVGALAEVTGDSAILVDPRDVDAIAGGIQRLVQDAGLRADLVRRGLLRARQFTWARTAAQTLQVYERAMAAPPRLARTRA